MKILILKNDVCFVFILYSLFCFIYVMDFLPIIVSNMISISYGIRVVE